MMSMRRPNVRNDAWRLSIMSCTRGGAAPSPSVPRGHRKHGYVFLAASPMIVVAAAAAPAVGGARIAGGAQRSSEGPVRSEAVLLLLLLLFVLLKLRPWRWRGQGAVVAETVSSAAASACTRSSGCAADTGCRLCSCCSDVDGDSSGMFAASSPSPRALRSGCDAGAAAPGRGGRHRRVPATSVVWAWPAAAEAGHDALEDEADVGRRGGERCARARGPAGHREMRGRVEGGAL